MGREVRRVPMGWEPPKDANGHYQPQHDRSYLDAAREWMAQCRIWDDGTSEEAQQYKATAPFYWDWDGMPPKRDYYRPDWAALGLEPTGYALYETVSEGTPVTPTFATPEELVEYLVRYGDTWDQRRHRDGWSREAAEHMVEAGWAPSAIIRDGMVQTPRNQTG